MALEVDRAIGQLEEAVRRDAGSAVQREGRAGESRVDELVFVVASAMNVATKAKKEKTGKERACALDHAGHGTGEARTVGVPLQLAPCSRYEAFSSEQHPNHSYYILDGCHMPKGARWRSTATAGDLYRLPGMQGTGTST